MLTGTGMSTNCRSISGRLASSGVIKIGTRCTGHIAKALVDYTVHCVYEVITYKIR
jgi:hypothetical protein